MKKITLENIKNIKHLDFFLPNSHGVFLLVGANGMGKTTLLVCLDRIGNPLAFAHGFLSSQYNDQIDRYRDTAITYDIDDPELHFTFHKGTRRWTATPRIDSSELTKYGYTRTVFIQANSKRIDVTTEDIRRGEFVNAATIIKEELNEIFETNKYNKLKRLKNTRGRGKTTQFFYVIQDGNGFYSEKRFSTGELAILRLVESIKEIEDNALILIDEAEMALHPRIQQNLLKYLRRKAEDKRITVIMSTHSSTMIKATDKEHILLLSDDSQIDKPGYYEIVNPCYPAKAVGFVDYLESAREDAVIFVEDEMSRILLRKMLARCTNDGKYSTLTVSIVPVGGYENTAKLALETKKMLFADAKVLAVWDEDVFSETIPQNPRIGELFDKNKDTIFNLGCTPELFMVRSIENADLSICREIRKVFRVDIISVVSSREYSECHGDNVRKVAKAKLDVIIDNIASISGFKKDVVLDKVADIIIEREYDDKKSRR